MNGVKRVRWGVVGFGVLALAGSNALAQTDPGVGGGFETLGMLYSGSGPFHGPPFPAGDGWAQGVSGTGVLDADGNPTVDPWTGELFRAEYVRDGNWGNGGSGVDASVFAGSNKNNDAIGGHNSKWDWETGGGGPQKNDLTNAYLHTRVDPVTGDRWVFLAAETRSTGGDSHVDFEFNQAGVEMEPDGRLVGLGPDRGRTLNDFMVSVDFEGGENPVAQVRYWDGNSFELTSAPSAAFSATNLVEIIHGQDGSWKHFDDDGRTVEYIERLQFVEAAVNLTVLGIDVDPCTTNATMMIKTRSSSSFTADLKDFILVGFPLEPLPDPVASGPDAVCPGDTFDVAVEDLLGLSNPAYAWEFSGPAEILSDPTAATVTVRALPGACADEIVATVSVTAGACTDVAASAEVAIVVEDVEPPSLVDVPTNVFAECNDVPGAPTVSAIDGCSEVGVDYSEATTPGSCPSEYTITRTWTATDACGNVAVGTQLVFVQDTTPPAIRPTGDRSLFVCDQPGTTTISVSDDCGPVPTFDVDYSADNPDAVQLELLASGDYRFTLLGAATVTVSVLAIDECGNPASDTFTLTAECGSEACSAGYFRNNLDGWCTTGFNPLPDYCRPGPATLFVDAFQLSDLSAASGFDASLTLLTAVSTSGGDFNQALRQGSASLLNAASTTVDDFPFSVWQVRQIMQDAFRGTITFAEAAAIFTGHIALEGQCGCPVTPPPAVSLTDCDGPTTLSPDLNADGVVDTGDLLMLLGAWGTPGADLNDDGTTDTQDVLMLLAAWGTAG